MVRRHPWERRRPRRQGFPGCIRVRPPTLEPLSTGATGYSSTAETVMVSGPPCERRRPRRQGFPNSMRVRPPTPEPLPTGATGYSSQRSVLGRRGRRRSQVGIRGTLPASQVSLQHFPRLTGRRWRVPVRSVRLTDRAGHRRFASAGKDHVSQLNRRTGALVAA